MENLSQVARVAAVIGVLLAVGWWIRTTADRLLNRVPLGVRIALVGLCIAISVVLGATSGVTRRALVTMLLLAVAAVIVRAWINAPNPYHSRWQRVWSEVAELIDRDPAEADRLVLEAARQDATELDRLRALAPNDRRAAAQFRARLLRDLQALLRSEKAARRLPKARKGTADLLQGSLASHRAKLEEDLRWVDALLR